MRRLLAVGLVFALFGCNHPTSEGTGSSSGSTSATGGGTGTTSSGSGSTSGGSSGSTGTTGTTGSGSYRGYVLFNNIDVTGFYTNHTVTAAFASEDAGINVDPLQNCSDGTPEPNGCCYRDNTGGGGNDGGGFTWDGGYPNADGGGFNYDGGFSYDGGYSYDGGSAPNAGDLTLSANGTQIATMSPGAGGLYAPTNATWSPGDQVSATAAGADVHAFSGAVTAPTSATITAPQTGGFPPASVSTSSALLVTWTGTGTKAAVILASGFTQGGASKSVTCYGDNHGQLTITATSMAHFAGEQYGALLVGLGNTQDVSVDNATVTIAADTLTGGAVSFQ